MPILHKYIILLLLCTVCMSPNLQEAGNFILMNLITEISMYIYVLFKTYVIIYNNFHKSKYEWLHSFTVQCSIFTTDFYIYYIS